MTKFKDGDRVIAKLVGSDGYLHGHPAVVLWLQSEGSGDDNEPHYAVETDNGERALAVAESHLSPI